MIDQPQTTQTLTNFQLAGLVAKDVELESVLLTRADLESHVVSGIDVTELELAQHFRPRFELLTAPRRLKVCTAFVLDLTRPGEQSASVLHLSAEYSLTYKLPDPGPDYTKESLECFAELNGTLNVWPYWRELVHTVVARVGLGSITLPVWRAQARPVEPRAENNELRPPAP